MCFGPLLSSHEMTFLLFAERRNYSLVAVGSRGEMPEEIKDLPCVEERTTELRHLP